MGRRDACDQVGCPWAGCPEANPDLASSTGIAIGGMYGSLFMPHQKVLQLTPLFEFVEFIINGQNRTTRIPKNMLHSMALEAIKQGISARNALLVNCRWLLLKLHAR
jgi:hypothetical protein